MKTYDVIIIGSGPAGIITGVTAKKRNPDKSILLLGESQKGLVPCGIPYVFHRLDSVDKNKMGPKPFMDAGGDFQADKAVDIDPEKKVVTLDSGQAYEYGKLVFATGSTPVVPKFIKGYDLDGVEYIKKNYDYIEGLVQKAKKAKHIVVIGGGFIGAEVAEQLQLNGTHNVSLVEMEKYCFCNAFSTELADIATEELKKTGVNVMTSTKVTEIRGENGSVQAVKLDSGKEIEADMVIAAIGYRPNTELAKKTGLKLNKIGAIVADQYGRTSVNDISAVGDCAGTTGFLTGKEDTIMLASTATAEARVCGYNLFGICLKRHFAGTLGVFSTEINGMVMAAAGVNARTAYEANVNHASAVFSDVDRHPGAFDDCSPLSVRLYVSVSDGSVIGGEVWGGKTAGEIVNTISMAIQTNVTVYELVSFQFGTHPLLTTAPTKYVLVKAAEAVINKIR